MALRIPDLDGCVPMIGRRVRPIIELVSCSAPLPVAMVVPCAALARMAAARPLHQLSERRLVQCAERPGRNP
jgi:hypothetical protein